MTIDGDLDALCTLTKMDFVESIYLDLTHKVKNIKKRLAKDWKKYTKYHE